jgi:phenylalanyl-tRNA synthetase beta chain
MPTISLAREKLFALIGQRFTDEEFDELCFSFGIELDDITSERLMAEKESATSSTSHKGLSEEVIYKIEIPANRCDLLCLEGLSRALRIFLGKEPVPKFELAPAQRKIFVSKALSTVRPFVVGAVLRCKTSLSQEAYDSFISMQDKLHGNVCRKRTLVSIGTHDLDKIAPGPIKCCALPPAEIKFIPLGHQKEFQADSLMQHYADYDLYLRQFIHIIRDSPVYPVFLDSTGQVLSLPPIVNSEYSKITAGQTKNIFVEICAMDLTKAKLVLDVLTTAFSQYCIDETVEEVEVVYEDSAHSAHSGFYPRWTSRSIPVSLEYINRKVGISLGSTHELQQILFKMGLPAKEQDSNGLLLVTIPANRPDILHLCDIMEDAAIGYGFNNISKTLPRCCTIGAEQPISKLTDALRKEMAFACFDEILTLTLCSKDENYGHLNRSAQPGQEAVVLSNPQTIEFEIVRTSLLPGTLKTLACNKSMPLPMRLFEVSDVVVLDPANEVGARNERHLICLVADSASSGLEVIRSVLNRLMAVLAVAAGDWKVVDSPEQCTDGAYFPGRRAVVHLDGHGIVGHFGCVHPEACEKFGIPFACSALEMNIEPFL